MSKTSSKKVTWIGKTNGGKKAVAKRNPLGEITNEVNGIEKNAESKEKTTMTKKRTKGTTVDGNKTETSKELAVNKITSQENLKHQQNLTTKNNAKINRITRSAIKNLHNDKPINIEEAKSQEIDMVKVESQKVALRTTRRQAQEIADKHLKSIKNKNDSINLKETEHEMQDESQKAPLRTTRRKAQETLKKNLDLPLQKDTNKSKLQTTDNMKASKNKNSTKSKEVIMNLQNEKPTNIKESESEHVEDPIEVESQKAPLRTSRRQAQKTTDNDVKKSKNKSSTKSNVVTISNSVINLEKNEQIEESPKAPLRTIRRRAPEALKKNDLPVKKPQITENDEKPSKNKNSTKSKNDLKSEKSSNARTRNRSKETVKNEQTASQQKTNEKPSTSRTKITNKNNVQSKPVEDTKTSKNEEAIKVPLKSDVPNQLPAAKNQIFKHKIVELELGKNLKLPNEGSGNIGVSLFLNNQFKTDKGKKKKVVHPPTHRLVKTQLRNDPPKTLRPRNPVNYAEISLNNQNIPSKSADDEKIPIYKRPVHDDHHNDEDEYEFDSDSENPKKKRKKKEEDSDDSSLYDKKMMKVLTKIATKIKKRKQENGKVNNVKLTVATDALERGELGLVVNSKTKPQPIDDTENLGNHDDRAPSPDQCDNAISDHEDVPEEQQEISRCFGFEDLSPITKRRLNPIIVHQNVAVDSPQLFHKRRPTANSTMLESSNSPWRYNYNIKRRPYFVRIKTSGLPAIQQDPVIDHTFDKTPPERPKDFEGLKKEPVQTSIMDYIPGTEHLRTNDKPQDLSLFDMHQFSPIKRKPANASITPRNVLGIRNDIVNAVSTPLPKAKSAVISPDLSNIMQESDKENESSCFGFAKDLPDDSLKPVNNEAKPSRFSLNTLKQYKRKPQLTREKSPVPEIQKPIEVAEIESEVHEENENKSTEIVEVHLFEDLEKPDTDVAPKKSRKRTKFTSSVDPDELEAKRRKREKEDPELEKWAADMTAHFNEIENFDLEIE